MNKDKQKKNGQRIWTFSSEKTSMAPTKKAKMVGHLTCNQKYKLNDILNISFI